MDDLRLGFDEAVISKFPDIDFDSTRYGKGKGDLYLTNKNYIILKKGLFGKVKDKYIISLKEVKVFEGKPQIIMDDKGFGEDTLVDIYFVNGQIEIKFDDDEKKYARTLIYESYKLLADEEALRDFENSYKTFAFSGAEQIAQTIKGTIETFKDTIIGQQEASAICSSCGGLINGFAGKTSKCPFCGNNQKL